MRKNEEKNKRGKKEDDNVEEEEEEEERLEIHTQRPCTTGGPLGCTGLQFRY